MFKKNKKSTQRRQKPRQTEMICMRITLEEKETIKKKAGAAGVGQYIKYFLRTQTDLFK